jgi:hypothetical protein
MLATLRDVKRKSSLCAEEAQLLPCTRGRSGHAQLALHAVRKASSLLHAARKGLSPLG